MIELDLAASDSGMKKGNKMHVGPEIAKGARILIVISTDEELLEHTPLIDKDTIVLYPDDPAPEALRHSEKSQSFEGYRIFDKLPKRNTELLQKIRM